MARSMTVVARRAATTLIAPISKRALFFPTVSISHAAFIVRSRACSIAMRDSAMRSWITPWSARCLPNVTRICARLHMSSSASSAMPIARMQWWMRPGPSRACAIAKPPPSSPSTYSFGIRTFSYSVSQWPMPWSRPNTGIDRTMVTPGVSSGMSTMLWRRCESPSGSDTPMRMANVHRFDAAPLVNHLCAFTM